MSKLNNIRDIVNAILTNDIFKIIISNPRSRLQNDKKVIYSRIENIWQEETFTKDGKAYHKNYEIDLIELAKMVGDMLEESYSQFNAWDSKNEYSIMISKKGKITSKTIAVSSTAPQVKNTNNKEKNYLLPQGDIIPPLIDMGIFTKEGKIVNSMYDKYRQINRFIELLDDELKGLDTDAIINVIDFGCGKSYLTFIIYYYFNIVMGMNLNITGLDLKSDVIEKCNKATKRYGYDKLHFEMGDIREYSTDKSVDIVISLHACDIATDYAIYNAIKWNAKHIFVVPCCQHEINSQITSKSNSILTRHGIIKERYATLITDSIRANILTYSGYKTQVLEFVDLSHTPKNLLIRATKSNIPIKVKETALNEVDEIVREYAISPTLYRLIRN